MKKYLNNHMQSYSNRWRHCKISGLIGESGWIDWWFEGLEIKQERGESEKLRVWGEGERKNCKILNTKARVTVHICTVAIALVHKYTLLHPLKWVFFFLSKYVKYGIFSIMQDFATTDVNALISTHYMSNKSVHHHTTNTQLI